MTTLLQAAKRAAAALRSSTAYARDQECDQDIPGELALAHLEMAIAAAEKAEPTCFMCHGTGKHEMATARLPGQPEMARIMVDCQQCKRPAHPVQAEPLTDGEIYTAEVRK